MNDKFFEELSQELTAFAGAEQSLFASVLEVAVIPPSKKADILHIQNCNSVELFAKIGFLIAKHSVGSQSISLSDIVVTTDNVATAPESRPMTRKGWFGKFFNRLPKNNKDPEARPPVREHGNFYVRYKNSFGDDVYQIFSDEVQASAYAKLVNGVYGQL